MLDANTKYKVKVFLFSVTKTTFIVHSEDVSERNMDNIGLTE